MTRRPSRQTLETGHISAPVGGLNTVAAGTALPPGDSIQAWNLVAGEHGLRARLGYQETGVTPMTSPARTIIPYIGTLADGSRDRLFYADLFNVASVYPIDGDTQAFFPNSNGNTGRGIYHAFTTSAGGFLLYCDEEHGYFVYNESTDAWAQVAEGGGASQISGVNPANLCFVMVWKSRVWFVEKNSTNVWYLPAGAIFGTVTKLALAQSAQFRQGGDVIGLWNWTLDGGAGIDDYLVAATRGGDVAIYQGTDPASASTFALKGTWNAGSFVAGRRIATNFGGDVLLLTKSGIRPLSQLVAGGNGTGTYATAKVANLFSQLAQERGDLLGWDMCVHPEENALIVTVPTFVKDLYDNYETEQLVLSLWGERSWSRYRKLPILSMGVWKKRLYFSNIYTDGTDHGVWINTGHVDKHWVITAPTTRFDAIQWACLTGFNNLGNAQQKQLHELRLLVLAEAFQPTVAMEARYRYNLADIAELTELTPTDTAMWDGAVWDAATWTDQPVAYQITRGACGMGPAVAVAIRGTSRSKTTFVGVDVAYTQGGFL